MQYRENQYIDKTESLEKGISRFPSVYIEGNAVTGKTTAVTMLLEKHPEMSSYILDFKYELKNVGELLEKLIKIQNQLDKENLLIVVENIPKNIDAKIAECLAEAVNKILNKSCFIFVSREKPQKEFLELLWKNKMEVISMEKLFFSLEEVRTFMKEKQSLLDAEVLYEKTGGWPGVINVLLHLAESRENTNIEEILQSYEMKSYVHNEMLSGLTEVKKTFLSKIASCPWVNEKLAEEVWNIENAREKLENLQRKGFLEFEYEMQHWKIAPLFGRYILSKVSEKRVEAGWYEREGYIQESFWCLKQSWEEEAYRQCMLKYYDKVYAMGLLSEDVFKWTGKTPEQCYLRGIYAYHVQDFERLHREIALLKKVKEKDHKTKEVLLNLYYLDPQISLSDWLELVEKLCEEDRKFRLYQILGNSVTYLCGVRDLSGLFSCTRKEEKQKEHLWRNAFGEIEWKCYQFARIDYYLETERKDSIQEDDWNLLRENVNRQVVWQIRMANLFLLCKLQRIQPEEMRTQRIYELENSLRRENYSVCAGMAESISSLYAPWYGAREKMSQWLRYTVMDSTMAITEENYLMFYCRAKGYLLLNQYERAEKILKKLVPYLQNYRRNRFLAEVLFQYAMVNWGKDLKGQAVKNAIESFLISASGRYVRFYVGYGQKGQQVLEAFIEWQKGSTPEGWSRKKKYNYGNVLNMPMEDYLSVILRSTKKASKTGRKFPEEYIEERLTMMETIILQDIGRGMSNAEICEELGLKLPTVKGHVYSLFKKLGVNSRVQAVVRGKELGMLE